MRVKDYDLTLVSKNCDVNLPIEVDSAIESYYHMAPNCKLYDIDGVKFALFLNNMSNLRHSEYLQATHIVDKQDINRLDKISYKYYNTPELWWLIAEVNYIDPFDLRLGQELLIPKLSDFDFITMIKSSFQQRNENIF